MSNIIVYNDYFLTSFLFQELKKKDYILIKVEKKDNLPILLKISRKLEIFFFKKYIFYKLYFKASYISSLRSIKKKDKVLVFDIVTKHDVRLIIDNISTKQISIWIWNPLHSIFNSHKLIAETINFLKKNNLKLYSFEMKDVEKYKLFFKNQVYRNVDDLLNTKEIKYDFFFVGRDKGRLNKLIELMLFLNANYNTFFYILPDIDKHYTYDEKKYLQNNYLEYIETINSIITSKCLIEIVQENQTGLTLRALEAVHFKKKLITNNYELLSTELYHPNNIFFLNKYDLNSLNSFLESDVMPFSNEILTKYQISDWILEFFE